MFENPYYPSNTPQQSGLRGNNYFRIIQENAETTLEYNNHNWVNEGCDKVVATSTTATVTCSRVNSNAKYKLNKLLTGDFTISVKISSVGNCRVGLTGTNGTSTRFSTNNESEVSYTLKRVGTTIELYK